ncbi:cytochrome-c oxidase, cbb3-type subunit III [Roseobacter sp. YSTF-M11]|uniref:Cbb3-type cytochrome c oxidase subunit n=1 Tax=Roseobacter insulae TaxID=2859783 RepID=A0A9X1JXU4_9RHOB|nr:cytochrome-c oxidase, cbb3-type subunit III [Roseobacter insulae]MBW4707461.1 cytochrome-c oxidase, cbb3-type subunit III [Roseobacter insulae]
MTSEIDQASGQPTTGHEWDGIRELDTPVPRSMSLCMWVSIAASAVLWVLYPAFPFINDYTRGVLGYSSRTTVTQKVNQGNAARQAAFRIFADKTVTELAQIPDLKHRFGEAIGVLYRDNCSACHGRDLAGQANFPNLADAHWLWSGTPDDIELTLQHGINHSSEDTRYAEMPAFGRDGMLEKDEIAQAVEYVLSLSGSDHDTGLAEIGAGVFADSCAACHGDAGTGGLGNGAPSLADGAWIYGGSRDALHETLRHGRAGVMPGWANRLSPEEIRMLTLYVLWAGQDDKP